MKGKRGFNIWVAVWVVSVLLNVPAIGRTIYVDIGGGGETTSIQVAINTAVSGVDEIEVKPGTYNESINFIGKAVRVYSSDGPQVTTINGSGYYHVVIFAAGELRNTVLEGFTITGGVANGVADIDKAGGGILCSLSSPTIVNCIVTGNWAFLGGGIYSIYSNLAIIGCKINYNVGSMNGGGLYFYWYYPVVINCEIRNNVAMHGGGMMSDYSQATITNSTFSANTATVGFSGALASLADGLGNTPYITNCILWGDLPAEIAYATFIPIVQYCDVQGIVFPLPGNISADPFFVNVAAGNLQLLPGSPCIDTGYNAADTDVFTAEVQPLPEDDLIGNDRIYNGVVDMGAYELRDSDGDGIPDVLDTPSVHNLTQGTDHFTVQAAINSAKGGDEIAADNGEYNESVNLKGKAIILRSSDPNNPNVVENTIIDATGLGTSAVACASGEGQDTVLSGFTITGGSAVAGGGMIIYLSSPTVMKCVFTGNTASLGAGLYNHQGNPTITSCAFTGNTATGDGGGMYSTGSGAMVTNCSFVGNTSSNRNGGGMYNKDSNLTVTDCNFTQNTATLGGGMYNRDSSPTVNGCTFSDNTSLYSSDDDVFTGGGGMLNTNSSPIVTNCTFHINTANRCGSGMCNIYSSSPTVTNCSFVGNSAVHDGGGMQNYSSSSPIVTDCNFINNTTDYDGGGINNDTDSNSTVTNCTFRGNTVGHNGGGMQNYNSDPNVSGCTFINNEAGGGGGGLVNHNGSDADVNDCVFISNLASTGGGLYNTTLCNPTVRDCTFTSNNANVGGGLYNQNNCAPIVTDCNFSKNTAESGGGMSSFDECSETVTDCTFSNNYGHNGGGMYSSGGSSQTVVNCVFNNNRAIRYGGGVSGNDSNSTYSNCTFNGNTAGDGGGGMCSSNSSPTVSGCRFIDNVASLPIPAGRGGGGILNDRSNSMVNDCIFSGNTAMSSGGGMLNYANEPTVINCVFNNNSATWYGGGVSDDYSYSTYTNCTFSGNTSIAAGGAISKDEESFTTLTNCILWGDSALFGPEIYGIAMVTYSDVQDYPGGIGNISADPCFVDPNGGDLRLQPDSPCKDIGDNGATYVPTTDIDGHPRIVSGDCDSVDVVDMGAYEFNYAYMGDLDYNCIVDFFDYSILGSAWRTKPADAQWNHLCDIGVPADNYIGWRDLAILGDNWLALLP